MEEDIILEVPKCEDRPKTAEPCESVTQTMDLAVGAAAVAALAALGVSAYDSDGNEKDVGTLMSDIKNAVRLDK